jgi:uncharacterized glyoxalase superfamily protein PhnB
MRQEIAHFTLVVRDYDEAIEFYCNTLKFDLLEDTYQPEQDKRWVVVAPHGSKGVSIVLAQPSKEHQQNYIGDQTGGRVSFFLNTDNFKRDYDDLVAKGVEFVRDPVVQPYGTVAVFKDLYGNQWDLLELAPTHPIRKRLFSE